jgi:protein O-GlcNAc transferase
MSSPLARLAGKVVPRLLVRLAGLFQARGHPGLAQACYRQASRLDPADAQAHFLLGRQLLLAGEAQPAAAALRKAIEARPNHAEAHNNLGVALYESGQTREAADCYRAALQLRPDYAAAHNNLGNVQLSEGQTADAEASFRRALQSDPGYAEAHNNLGLALMRRGNYPEAEAALREALRINPRFAGALSNLGSALQGQGRIEDAIASYHEALRHRPDLGEAHANLGIVLGDTERLAQAIGYFEQQLRRNPSSAEAHNRLGSALQAQTRYGEAYEHFQKAMAARPDYAEVYVNVANNYVFLGMVEKALESYRKALSYGPNANAQSSYAFYLNYSPGHTAAEVAAEYRLWGATYATPADSIVKLANSRDGRRRLRIGYVSPDFCEHPVSFFLEPVLRHHDRSRVEVFCYANGIRNDDVTKRLKGLAVAWRDISLKPNRTVRELVREDAIDILVDLAGHTSRNRLTLFTPRAAPVQVTYLGHPNTTGVETMDYRLTDALADPPSMTETYHSEELFRLPRCFLAYAAPENAPAVAPAPFVRKGHVTFGSFNNAAKVNPRTVAAWSRILREVPGSRLLLKNFSLSNPISKRYFAEMLTGEGIAAERFDLLDSIPELASHLDLYGEIDVALDTFPYNGTTTTCEALWMGVPVVGLAGPAHVSRVGVSLLHAVGLSSLVGRDEDEYVRIAVEFGNDPERLQELRTGLRERLQASELGDAAGLTRAIEDAYGQMWGRWVAHGEDSDKQGADASMAS